MKKGMINYFQAIDTDNGVAYQFAYFLSRKNKTVCTYYP
jgi:hypothetical protein